MTGPTTTDFAESVREAFAFLLAEYGFREKEMYQIPLATLPMGRSPIELAEPLPLRDRASFVEFAGDVVTVRAVYDPRGELQVSVASHRLPERQRADLFDVLKSQGVPNTPHGWLYDWGRTTVQEAAVALGTALSAHGARLLRDDPAAWEDLWRWRTSEHG